MTETEKIIAQYQSIELEEMESVKLMNRTDTKFVLPAELLPELLRSVMDSYRSLEIAGKRMSTYQTLYFDTSALNLYNHHRQGKLNRYKVRQRSYCDTGLTYLEVKFKNNKGRTIKERIKRKGSEEEFRKISNDFLSKELPFDHNLLEPVVWVNYKRITLVNKRGGERVTIDTDLHFIHEKKRTDLDKAVIVEVKQEKRASSPITHFLRGRHVREGGVSKYCMAIAATREKAKINTFKEKFLNLKKITSHDIIADRG